MSAEASIPPKAAGIEEVVSPREARLERGATVLRRGAIANGIVSGLLLLLAIIGGFGVLPGLFGSLRPLLWASAGGGQDAAAAAILLSQVNLSLLLVLMVGVQARETWALVGVWVLVAANGVALALMGFTPALVTIVFAVWAGLTISRDVRAFRMNPVMLKELRGRMRGMRAFVVLTVYLGLMSGFTVLLYLMVATTSRTLGSAAGEVGRLVFSGVVGIELMLIVFIAPAFTAGAITGERERLTYDLLKITLLPSPSFVIGKLESALGYVLLLLLAAIPLQSIAFLFGGVTELELVLSFVILTVTAIALGTVGIFFSAIMERTLSASIRAYMVTLVATFGAPLVLSVVLNVLSAAIRSKPAFLEILFVYLNDFLTSLNPIATAVSTQQLLINRQVIGFWTDTLASTGATIPRVSPWITFTIIYLVASTVLVVLSVQRMRKIEG